MFDNESAHLDETGPKRTAESIGSENLKVSELASSVSIVELIGLRGGNIGERSFTPEVICTPFFQPWSCAIT